MNPLLLGAAFAAAAAPAQPSGPRLIDVSLVASTMAPKPGATFLVGFRMAPRAGWHSYWSNPGGSGLAPSVTWSAPPGVRFGPLLHPAPGLLQSMGVVSYVHSGAHVLLTRVTVGAEIPRGTPLPVTAELSWAACSANQCVPQHQLFSLQMIAGDGALSPAAGALEQALAALPASAPKGSYSTAAGKITLQLPATLRLDRANARFFPDANGYFDPLRASVTGAGPLTIVAPLDGTPPERVTGVVSDGSAAYRISFERAAAMAVSREPAPTPTGPEAPLPSGNQPAPAPPALPPGDPTSTDGNAIPFPLILFGIAGLAFFAFALAKRPYR